MLDPVFYLEVFGTYLGNLIVFCTQKHPLLLFSGQLRSQLQGWKTTLLSLASKICLINTTLVTLSNHVTSIFQITNTISRMINAIIMRFFKANANQTSSLGVHRFSVCQSNERACCQGYFMF